MKKLNKSLVACAVAAGLSAPFSAMATNGYFSHGYGTQHKGMAGAGVALPQSTLSTATNPAALVSMGNRIDFGLEYFKPNRSATTRDDNVTYEGNNDSAFLIPEFGYSSVINDTMSWGVVVYGNGGMNTRYNSIMQYAGGDYPGQETGVNMAQLFIAPTFAMKINEKNTFGVSLNLIYQTFEAYGLRGFCGFKASCTNGVDVTADRAGLTDQGEDDSTGYSIKLGWLGNITDRFSLGVAYQTESDMSKFDKYNQLFAEQGDFDIPSNWTIGLKFKAMPTMNILFDIQQINYSDVASISNPNNNSQGALGTNNGRGFGWDDMTIYKLGLDYQVNDNLIVRAGYSHGDQPIGADDTSFNLIAPAVIEDHLTLGATWTLANKSELTAYYMHAFENEVTGNTNTMGSNGNANLKMDQDALGVAYGWQF